MRAEEGREDVSVDSAFPRLRLTEWVTFAVVTALLSVANVYAVLLTGMGDGGALLSVLTSVLVLRAVRGRVPGVQTLNLGQTMGSAGGYMGCAAATYAAVVIAQPHRTIELPWLVLLFLGLGTLGTLCGVAMRRWMVRYQFPTGTACAVIQRTLVEKADSDEGQRPLRLLARWGTIGGIATVPTKIALEPGAMGVLPPFLNPLCLGIGVVVGPRIGCGLLVGLLLSGGLVPLFFSVGATDAELPKYFAWTGSALMLVPSLLTLVLAWRARQAPPPDPSGFAPGTVTHGPAPVRGYAALAAVAMALVAGGAHAAFGLPVWMGVAAVLVSIPLCVINGRVAGDTDSNLIGWVPLVLLSVFLLAVDGEGSDGAVVALLGVGIVGIGVVTAAVDALYDYRAGYLLNANPTQQTWVQLLGVLIGSAVAVPVVYLLAQHHGFGEGGFPAPMPKIFATMVSEFANGTAFPPELAMFVGGATVFGCVYALLAATRRFGRWMPSLFGVGLAFMIGPIAIPIFLGGVVKWVLVRRSRRGLAEEQAVTATARAERDCLLAGSSIFVAAALASVFVVFWHQVLAAFGIRLFYLAL